MNNDIYVYEEYDDECGFRLYVPTVFYSLDELMNFINERKDTYTSEKHTMAVSIKIIPKNDDAYNLAHILTELEEWLNKEILDGRSKDHLWLQGCYDEDKLILDKIQKLKERYK